MVESILSQSDSTNCKEDLDEFLLTLDLLPSGSGNEELFEVQPSPYESLVSDLPESVRNILSVCSFHTELTTGQAPGCDGDELTTTEVNIMAYIGGYILRKLRGKVCQDCYSLLLCTSDSDSINDESLSFINMKKYVAAKDGLILPSKTFVDVLSSVEKEFRSNVDEAMYSEHVKTSLVSNITKKVDFASCYCNSCKCHLAIVHLMVNIRLHHTLKLANRSLRQEKSRRNRKVLKFAHL